MCEAWGPWPSPKALALLYKYIMATIFHTFVNPYLIHRDFIFGLKASKEVLKPWHIRKPGGHGKVASMLFLFFPLLNHSINTYQFSKNTSRYHCKFWHALRIVEATNNWSREGKEGLGVWGNSKIAAVFSFADALFLA